MYRRIMVVVDERPVSDRAASEAVAIARIHQAEVEFLAVVPRLSLTCPDPLAPGSVLPLEAERVLHRSADNLTSRLITFAECAGVMARGHKVSEDDGVVGVVEAARRLRCELIVVASSGHNAVMRLFVESLVPGLITASPVPVLVCKAAVESRTHLSVSSAKARRTQVLRQQRP